MDKKPLVSICVPLYNSKEFIEETIESALKQTYPNIELVIVDDCSKDGSYEIAKKYAKKYKKIKLYQNKKNLGMVNNWNRCIELSKGEYFNMLHGDDVLRSTFVEESLKTMAEYNADFSFSSFDTIDENSNVLRTFYQKFTNPLKKEVFFEELLKSKVMITIAGFLIKKSVFDRTGYFVDWYHHAADTGMWLKVAREAYGAVVSKPLVGYRVHKENHTNYMDRINASVPMTYNMFMDIINRYNLQKRESRIMGYFTNTVLRNALYLISIGETTVARNKLFDTFMIKHINIINPFIWFGIFLSCTGIFGKAFMKSIMFVRNLFRRKR